ncbi:MAG: hypothetical protein H0T92_19250 [Pyrinomonadaceae bacterium]|nr:hypothetical protein [Pyrinomonadaceae bacterium]
MPNLATSQGSLSPSQTEGNNMSQEGDAVEQSGLQELKWQVTHTPQEPSERWFVVRLFHDGTPLGYGSPIWARWY